MVDPMGPSPESSVQPGQLRAVAALWRDAAQQLRQASTGVQSTVKGVGDHWEGAAKEAFHQGMTPFDDASVAVEKALTSAAQELDNLAAGPAGQAGGDAPMAQAATRISGYLSQLSPKFSELAAPDGSRYADTHPAGSGGDPAPAAGHHQDPGAQHHGGHGDPGTGDSPQDSPPGEMHALAMPYQGDTPGDGSGVTKPGGKNSKRAKVAAGVAAIGLAAGGAVGVAHQSGSSHHDSAPVATATQDGKAPGSATDQPVSGGKKGSFEITLYGWPDNSPPGGDIAYSKIHHKASGSGTFDDPATFATDSSELAPGTKVYDPYLKRYFIMEDDCVECDGDFKDGKKHIDMWLGGEDGDKSAVLACEDKLTQNSGQVIIDPPAGEPVDTTPLFDSGSNRCYAP